MKNVWHHHWTDIQGDDWIKSKERRGTSVNGQIQGKAGDTMQVVMLNRISMTIQSGNIFSMKSNSTVRTIPRIRSTMRTDLSMDLSMMTARCRSKSMSCHHHQIKVHWWRSLTDCRNLVRPWPTIS